jgi:peroxiredoxin
MGTFLTVSIAVLWIAVFFNLFLTVRLAQRINTTLVSNSLSLRYKLQKGERAPAFRVQTIAGQKTVTEGNFRRQQTLLIFISPYCQPCRDKMLYFQSQLTNAVQHGWQVLFISDGTSEVTQHFAQEFGLVRHFAVPLSSKKALWEAYGVEGLPFYCHIDKQGIIQSVGQPDHHCDGWKIIVNSWETASPQPLLVPTTP